MRQAFATAAGVPLAEVSLSLTGGSVALLFSIDDAQPERVAASLRQSSFGSAAGASQVLLAPVVLAPNVAVVTTHALRAGPALPPPPPPDAVYVHRVTTTFQLAGDVASFDRAGFVTALEATFVTA